MIGNKMRPIIGITQDMEYKADGKGFWAYLDRHYAEAVYRFGGMPMMIPILGMEAVPDIIGRIDGLLLSGGDDIHPRYYGEEPGENVGLSPDLRTDFEFALLKEAIAKGKPVLGICLGVQAMDVFFGGTLHQDVPGHKGKGEDIHHEVSVADGSLLKNILGAGTVRVNSFHHQTIKDVGKGLVASAVSPDGIVEAVEYPGGPFVLGVQWHPERMQGDASAERLFKAFISASINKGA